MLHAEFSKPNKPIYYTIRKHGLRFGIINNIPRKI